MAEKLKTQEEPSIEEILGSIRRIIAEDDDEDVAEATVAESDPADEAPAQVAETQMVVASDEEEIEEEPLELTQKIDPEGTIEDVAASEEIVPEPTIDIAMVEPEIETVPEQKEQEQTMTVEEVEPMTDVTTETQAPEAAPSVDTPDKEALLSETTAQAASAVIAKLARHTALNDEGHDGVTVEAIVREMLRPMLKEWLDQNLPELVQTMVERELEKLTKRL